ncbi:sugar transferase [Halegenticoccus tardaugens]|uniref:sugar transferase n=1 Tax=Halegenticoccus tardaugens TaxID=2071624 RepID=UPI001E2C451D|nr:sugar transferase [Halegenticoccus tardaugens]
MTTVLMPLFKPQPRRISDVISLTQKRVFLGAFILTTVGYFDYTFRLPRITLVSTTLVLLIVLPAWFVALRQWNRTREERIVIIGDTHENIRTVYRLADAPIVGYISPGEPPIATGGDGAAATPYTDGGPVADGGQVVDDNQVTDDGRLADDGRGQVIVTDPLAELEHLGGLSQLNDILVEHDVDTAILAFSQSKSQEFFGVLDVCYGHGVTAKVHRDQANDVLTSDALSTDDLVEVDLSPLDWQDQFVKRLFDISFAAAGLLAASPFVLLIAIAIKLDGPGPVFYGQKRTAEFGDTFRIYKFRTMLPDSESVTPTDDDENDRITRVGRVLRKTHLDEIPQLWSILTGKMSVVGPRAVWTDEEAQIERETEEWRKRWFVKPGLTGFAQIHDVSSTQPNTKLRYDVEYIKRQSFWFDVKIVIRQVWKIVREFRSATHD